MYLYSLFIKLDTRNKRTCRKKKKQKQKQYKHKRNNIEKINIIIIISGFGIYGAAVVPDFGVGNTWQHLPLVLHEFLSNGLTPSRLHIVISFLTHADHVFLGLPQFLVPVTPNRVMELMHEVARCTCPYHLRHWVRRTAVISSISSFWWSTAEEISSSSFAPQNHLIMARSFLRSRCDCTYYFIWLTYLLTRVIK